MSCQLTEGFIKGLKSRETQDRGATNFEDEGACLQVSSAARQQQQHQQQHTCSLCSLPHFIETLFFLTNSHVQTHCPQVVYINMMSQGPKMEWRLSDGHHSFTATVEYDIASSVALHTCVRLLAFKLIMWVL